MNINPKIIAVSLFYDANNHSSIIYLLSYLYNVYCGSTKENANVKVYKIPQPIQN